MKMYSFNPSYGGTIQIFPVKCEYQKGGALAVLMYEHCDDENGVYDECYCDVTVNIPDACLPSPETDAFIDTNNSPWLKKFLKENGIAKPLGFNAYSGFCEYPAYRFDLSKLSELSDLQ